MDKLNGIQLQTIHVPVYLNLYDQLGLCLIKLSKMVDMVFAISN